MRISLLNQNKRKQIFDILNIFYEKEEIIFENEKPDIIIKDDFIIFEGENYPYKNLLSMKKNLYKILEKLTGYSSPWGILTGSKPSKLLQKYKRSDIKEKYLVSDKKLDLLKRVNKIQKKLYFDKSAYNLYINIPFCPSRCKYCSYPTIIGNNNDKSQYIKYVLKEIEDINLPKNLDTIYIGGGTPSFLSYKDIESLLEKINSKYTYREFSFEAGREDSLDLKKLKILNDNGVSRISINPQTFNKQVIKQAGRIQDMDRIIDLFYKANEMGFIVNMDFIIGLFGENRKSFKDNFKILEELQAQNLTFHALSQKVGSKYFEENILGSKKDSLGISDDIYEFINKNSYNPYYLYRQKNIISNLENVGYAKEGFESRYNILINEELENVVGLGMNSNSKFMNGKKYRNSRNLRDYIENINIHIEEKNRMIKDSLENKILL